MKSFIQAMAFFAAAYLVMPCFAQGMSQPTKEHELLKKDVGTWKAACKMWEIPGQPPMEFEGVETNRLLGGFWVISEFKGSMPGMTYEGSGSFGYDPESKKYVGTWVSNIEATMSRMQGTYDEKTKTLTMVSQKMNDGQGGKIQSKNVVVYQDENTRVMTMYLMQGGNEKKQLEIIYTKNKGPKKASRPQSSSKIDSGK